ncbi:hypothetical protein Pla163_27330 [Planctomycetes bacterium Pla163]|uniref:Nucleotidyl transferase AbiEii toxin, Type IV TA system n=1 Tax=Rohdeia mirabilis TaxID=2528008 RepID=A0A518D297_9BACT|nr:hypothetical protein Pla163_27330 [Planctomycetes bacterium Pla163]
MSRPDDGIARSVHVRLVRRAQELGVDPNQLIVRYGIERFLYRLSRSPHSERFVLKGGLLMLARLGETLRPTRDADLLGIGDLSDEALGLLVRDICEAEVEPDGVTLDPDSVALAGIREQNSYGGRRITLDGRLGNARLRLQIDVGIGDVVTPEPDRLDYPTILELPAPRLYAYPRESVVAEKLHAIVHLGAANTRMKDYFDLFALAKEGAIDLERLARAVAATFVRRSTRLPDGVPSGLTDTFADEPSKRAMWRAFLDRSRLEAPDLRVVVRDLRGFLVGPLGAAARMMRER